MVAIVGGSRLGLTLGSFSTLGQRGVFGSATQGRSGERAYVNVATGDLVLQTLDAALAGIGPDTSVLRTYNSHGGWGYNIDDGNGWQAAPRKYVRNLGSGLLRRYDHDGATLDYRWDEAQQLFVAVSTLGSAVDTIQQFPNDVYTWTDGATGATETYEGGGWAHIIASTDTSGNSIRYTYDNRGLLTRVTMADGETVEYTYGGIGKSDLQSVTTRLSSGQVLRQVSYTYDNHGRMTSVTVSLDPTGDVPDDRHTAQTYVTRYTYDGTTNRVLTVTQSDGTSLAFTYVRTPDNVYRVATVTDGNGEVTRFSYDIEARTTVATDPLGVSTVFQYDLAGQLTQVRTGVTASNAAGLSQVSYEYDALGNVTRLTDGLGNTVVLEYDGKGNLLRQVDAEGNTVVKTYDARNQVLTETVYASPAKGGATASLPQTTRYVYEADGNNLLRFVVSAEGRVTEHRYDARGQRIATIQYAAAPYDTASLADGAVPSESELEAWVAVQDLARTERSDMAYDFRGQLQTITTYGTVDASGDGVAETASTTTYVYDHRGLLLQTLTPDRRGSTQNVYDGLGRVVTSVAQSADGTLNNTTITQYDDANGRTTVTLANGLATTSAYDHAGRLVSVIQASAATGALGTTRYFYDVDGRLLMTEDPTGQRRWTLYDAAGRKVAEVDASGGLTEYVYDRANRVTQVIGHERAVDTSLLVDAAGQPTTGRNPNPGAASITLDAIRPAGTERDSRTWNIYDDSGRLAWQVDALGYVTRTEYDGTSRIVAVTKYANAIDTSTLAGASAIAVDPDEHDRAVTRIYNRDGLLRAVIDGEGYFTETQYDAAGQAVETIAYASKVNGFVDAASIAERVAAARAANSLDGLRPTAHADDVHAFTYYNARGQRIAQVDGEGYLTETVYDVNGNVRFTYRYAERTKVQATATSTVAELRPGPSPRDQVAESTWDALGRLSTQRNVEGTVTRYTYDVVGRVVRTDAALDTEEQRTLLARYDVQGRLTAELSAEGAALITGNTTQEQIDEIWLLYATRYTYDAAGRKTTSTDANGLSTVFFYDEVGRLRFTVNAAGEVQERTYDALGRLRSTAQYDQRIAAADLAAFHGGVLSVAENADAARALEAAREASTRKSLTELTYSARGEIVEARTALTAIEQARFTTTYDAFGGVVRTDERIDATRSLVTESRYDRRGYMTAQTADVGDASHVNATTRSEYDAFGRTTDAYDANGNHVHRTFDRIGRLVEIRDPMGTTRTMTYDAFARLLTDTDGRLNTTTYAYDDARRSVTVTTAENVTIETVHTRFGQTLTFRDGNGNVTTYSYDRNGNQIGTRSQVDATTYVETSSVYDRANRLVETYDANHNRVVYAYDAANRLLTRTVDPDGLALVTSYLYDAKGQQVWLRDANGVITETTFDLNRRVVKRVVDPGGLDLTTLLAWDARGNQLTVEGPGGTKTAYVYDDLGRRIRTVVDPDGLALTETYAYDDAGNVVSRTDGAQHVTRMQYDANNRLTFTVDAEGGVTRSFYDANGNVVERVTYAKRIDLAAWDPATAPPVEEDPAHDLRTRTVFDKMNRARFTVDGAGAAVEQVYDGNSNVIERIAYATPIDPDLELTATAFRAAVDGIADASRDARIRRTYDGLNRLVYSVDALGSVTHQVFDGNGNVLKVIAYATRIGLDDAPAGVPELSADRVVLRAYDAANRMRMQVDAMGGVTEQVLDGAGNIVQRIGYGTRLAAPTTSSDAPTVAEIEDALQAAGAYAGEIRSSRVVYDAANRTVFSVDAVGAVTHNTYDDAGNLIATTRYADTVDPSALPGRASAADVLSLLHPDDARDRTTLRAFDGANRVVYTVDASGYVRHNAYDGVGRVISTTLFAEASSGLEPGATVEDVAAAVAALANADRNQTSAFTFDKVGNTVGIEDALGFEESFTFDGAGRKLTFTNKSGRTWTYAYDAAGRLLQETLPPVSLTTVALDADGNLVQGETADVAIVNEITYDALGNVLTRTEAAGRPEQRVTSYVYDALGRQIRTNYPAVPVYDRETAADLAANGALGIATRTETMRSPYSETVYDAFGDAVANVDVSGNTSYKAYDALGRVRYEVDALGNVTGYQRNAFGDAVKLTRYATTPALSASAEDAPTADEIAAALALVDHAADRTISTDYDGRGRAVTVTQPEVWVFDGQGAGYLASSVVKSAYDAFGSVVRIEALSHRGATPDADVWAVTTQYFDRRGLQTATVNALGYLTEQAYDAAGNVLRRTEYAKALLSWDLDGYAAPATCDDDRTILSTWDRGNRKLRDIRVAVEFSTASDGTSVRGDVVTTYGWDAVGNLTRTTQYFGDETAAVAATTYTYYDALGRTIAVAAPAVPGAAAGTSVVPLMTFARDAHGNVLVRREYANGATAATLDGFTATESGADRVSLTSYDTHGHALQMTDAMRVSHFMSYDAAGRVAKQWQGVTSDDGYADGAFVHTLFTVYEYDALGRQTTIITPNSTSVLRDADGVLDADLSDDGIQIVGQQAAGTVTTKIIYNAFGEAVQRWNAPTGGTPQDVETFEYDVGGRLWRTNSGDGSWKVTLYDLMGNQTSLITSAGSVGSTTDLGLDLSTYGSAQEVDQLGNAGLRRTESERDLLGRVVRQVLPLRQDPWADPGSAAAAPYRPEVLQTFDRWGNVVTQSDVRNALWVTTYEYNANNQVIVQTQPVVSVLDGADRLVDAAPVTRVYYDALGRQVATRDANGNVFGQEWDASGRLVRELHADGGVVRNFYDALGNRVRLVDAEEHETTYAYDRLGRATHITSQAVDVYEVGADFAVTSASQAITIERVYDEAGRIVRSIDGNGAITRFTFDSRGDLVVTRQPLGQTNRSAFDHNSKQIASEDGNGYLSTWAYDGFGQLVGHRDFIIGPAPDVFTPQPVTGWATYWFEYDNAGQLVGQGNDRGDLVGDAKQNENLRYKYDAAGQMVQIRDESFGAGRAQETQYSYNAAGKRVWEKTSQEFDPYVAGNPAYQEQVLAYDALGRLALVSGLDGVEVAFQYDLFGNRRHQSVKYNTQAARVVLDYGAPIGEDDQGIPIYGYDGEGMPIYEAPVTGSHIEYDATARTQQLWFAYDAMNRQILVDGALNGNVNDDRNLVAGQGHRLAYDLDGNRISDTYLGTRVYEYQPPQPGYWHVYGGEWGDEKYEPGQNGAPAYAGSSDGEQWTNPETGVSYTWQLDPLPPLEYHTQQGTVTEYYGYDALERLVEVKADAYAPGANGVYQPLPEDQRKTLEVRHYDGASRVVEAGPLGALTAQWVDAFTQNASNAVSEKSRVSIYDGNGRLVRQRGLNPDGSQDSLTEYEVVTTWWEDVYGDPVGTDEAGTPIYGYDYEGFPIYTPPLVDRILHTRRGWSFQTEELVQKTDADGNPVFDADGNPVFEQATDGTGLPLFDENGDPIYVQATDADGNPLFDANGNPIYVQQVDADGNPVFDENGNPVYVPKTDGTGAPLFDENGNPIYKTYLQDHWVEGGYDNAGNVKAYRTTSQGVTSNYFFTQTNYDGYREAAVSGYRSDNAGGWGTTRSAYDANGYLLSLVDTTKGQNNRQFANDANGHVLLKRQENRLMRQLVVGGNVIAVYGAGTDLKMPTDDSGNPRWNDAQGNFDLNYQPITSAYPGPSAGQYTVRGGDTLQSIAQASYGDASLWYLIANANGLRGDQDLRIGQTLTIPTRVGARNTAETFKPYDPSRIVGDTTPNLPVPQSSDGGCGVLGIILTIVIVIVAVVVTVYTAGLATAALAPTLGTVGGAIVGGAVGGAVGSLVSQGLMMATGLQQDFSWQQVALGALGGAVGAGVGQAFNAVGLAGSQGLASWVVAGARAAITNAATQGIAVLTGLQEDFSWASVAASAVGAAVGAAVTEGANTLLRNVEGIDSFGKSVISGTLSGFASGVTVSAMRGGRIDVIRIAADAFGNALGNAAGESLQKTTEEFFQERAQRDADDESLTLRLGGKTVSDLEELDLRLKPGLDYGDVDAAAVDEQLGTSAAVPQDVEVTAESGDSISKLLGTSDPEVIGAFMAANGLKSSTIQAGRTYVIPGDPSAYDAAALGQSALNRDNARLAAIAEAAAADRARQEAAAAQAAAAEQAVAQQTQAASVEAKAEPGLWDKVKSFVAQEAQSNEAFYTRGIENSDSTAERLANRLGRALSGAGADIVNGLITTAEVAAKAVTAVENAVEDPLGTIDKVGDATMKAATAVGDAVMHPVDTAKAVYKETSELATSAYEATAKYVKETPVEQMLEDGVRVGASTLATMGGGKVLASGGKAVVKLAGEGAEAALRTLAPKAAGIVDDLASAGGTISASEKGAAAVGGAVRKAAKIEYGALDELGRPTGVRAIITKDMLGTGSDALKSIKPPGWTGNGTIANEGRGHLLARQLGGSGEIEKNLVTIQQFPANSPVMSGFESRVASAVRSGEVVQYTSTPIYNGNALAPRGITLSARGSGGFSLDVTVLNPVRAARP